MSELSLRSSSGSGWCCCCPRMYRATFGTAGHRWPLMYGSMLGCFLWPWQVHVSRLRIIASDLGAGAMTFGEAPSVLNDCSALKLSLWLLTKRLTTKTIRLQVQPVSAGAMLGAGPFS